MNKSQEAFFKAKKFIVGGVNSPVRAFAKVGGEPIFIKKALGAWVESLEGIKYLDFVGSYGPLINGHAHPEIIKAICETAQNGTTFGAPTELETQLAELVVKRIKCIDKIRMVSSGTEATMSAIRLARGATGRDFILKFAGCYHGHSDGLLVGAGSGALTLGNPDSLGVPKDFVNLTLSAPFNNPELLADIFKKYGDKLAAVIVEPIAGNMSCVIPSLEFHQTLRELCTKYGTVLIWDEVMTGFRVAFRGALDIFDIEPDLITYGKVIGGGMPVGAFAGKAELMDYLAPLGGVYQAGTLSGNPLAMAAGIANLKLTEEPNFYPRLDFLTQRLKTGLENLGHSVVINAICGMFGLFFTPDKEVNNFEAVQRADSEFFAKFFNGMLKEGIYLPPSAYETWFLSSAFNEDLVDKTIAAAQKVLAEL